ncbi:MAG: transporter permease subunit [Clostridiales bacterium]|jgi:peptide/nickel transport system permease protein|nr:transporter permease subunit [Clostridiales bacterium]
MSVQNQTTVKPITPGQLILKRFLRNKLAIAGFAIIVGILLFVTVGLAVTPYGEYEIFYSEEINDKDVEITDPNQSVTGDNVEIYKKAKPNSRHLLGTDKDGRDVLTRLLHGGKVSLFIAFACILVELAIGVTLGGIAGYYGGWVDGLIMRLVDVINCIPSLPVMLIMSSIMIANQFPQKYKIYALIGIMSLLGWVGIARIVRGQILSLREQEFMVATEAVGLSTPRRIFKHLIPNVMPQLIVMATLGVGSVILTESALSYLGFGVPFPYASWGNMVNTVNDPIIMKNNLNMWVPPGVMILLTVMAFNFLGDGLRDAFDPKMKR